MYGAIHSHDWHLVSCLRPILSIKCQPVPARSQ